MAPATARPFPFLSFPREIRDKVYRELLCNFDPPPTKVLPSTMFTFEQAKHSIDTAVLRTSTQIHREAYDVMVKTNRFVLIESAGGLPIRSIMGGLRVPVITADRDCAQRFKGYVLAVSLSTKKPAWRDDEAIPTGPCGLMILGRDVRLFCEAFTDGDNHMPGFSANLSLTITVGPAVAHPVPRYKNTLTDFFGETTQKTLLHPFRSRLRGHKGICVTGCVSPDLAKAVQTEIAQDECADHQKVFDDFAAAKERGLAHFRAKDLTAALLAWQDTALDIERIHRGSSWAGLATRGGPDFLARMAELYFLLELNIAHVHLIGMERGIPNYPTFDFQAEQALEMARSSIKKSFWADDWKWQPSAVQKAKLCYRTALFLRLEGRMEHAGAAMAWVEQALRLVPGDAAILREKEKIAAWVELGG
ncbi:hypothetical protein BU26DRAFT_517348 [Trematosphaeria pertusa]|uniref:Uncharacterized protein n=1 Tax=Trematosphaeria pertusa TaxID=390896 RepID=A0A6A6IJG6_9PLEO|nr:uncharacterized protein BU26DRAFT_517348 [Trematosphaeria pertusa]KAF2250516.1 hypothetical protein BU26DRAFT_517348 [Trematosphaeria pertusa]